MKTILTFILSILTATVLNAGIEAGVARKTITPEIPIWLSGYASRTKPADGILHDLWAKALVIKDEKDRKIVIVTIDIIGLTHDLHEEIFRRVSEKHDISRAELILNSSHTHSGPVLWPSLSVMYTLGDTDLQRVVRYTRTLADSIVSVIDLAFIDLEPANLFYGQGSAGIAVNRRQKTANGVVIGVNPEGPADHSVPVIEVLSASGEKKAVLFGYACHNTTLDIYQVNGDYAGFAQIEIEKEIPGTTAMYIAGCGADQNPYPRRSVELAKAHGKTLADAVIKVISGGMSEIHGPIKTSYTSATLEFRPVSTKLLKQDLLGDNPYKIRRANFILSSLEKGYDITKLSYPVQAVSFGNDFTLLALAGEVVVDYSLKTKLNYPGENLFVAGYSSEVQCYIPSKRILAEGGYEPETSMIYYGMPGPFADDVEERVFQAISKVMHKTGAHFNRTR